MRLEVDRMLALCGLFGGIPFLVLAYSMKLPLGLPVTVVTSCFAYLFITTRRSSEMNRTETVTSFLPSSLVISNVLFCALFCLSIIYLANSIYVRSAEYFVLLALSFALVAAEIVLPSPKPPRCLVALSLLKIVSLSLGMQVGRYVLFPTIAGVDPFYHSLFTRLVAVTGRVPEIYNPIGGSYVSFPGFHLSGATFSLVTGLPSGDVSLLVLGAVMNVVVLLGVFKLAQLFLEDRWSLFAALVASFASILVSSRFKVVPQLMGLTLFLYVVYLLMKGSRARENSIAIFLLVTSLAITHHLSSTVTLVSLAAIVATWAIMAESAKVETSEYARSWRSRLYVVLFLAVLVISYWTYAAGLLTFVVTMIVETIHAASVLSFPLHFLSWWESDMTWFGTYAIYWLAISGLLSYLSRRRRTDLTVSLVSSICVLLAIAYGFLIFLSSWAIVPDSWYPFALVLTVIPASHSVRRLVGNGSGKTRLKLMVPVIVFCLASFSIVSPLANDDSPMFANKVMRESFLLSEVQAAVMLNDRHAGTIVTDMHYGECFFDLTLRRELSQKRLSIIEVNMLDHGEPIHGLILIRTSGYHRPVRILTGSPYARGVYSPYYYVQRTYDPSFVKRLISRGNIVYNCQSAIAVLVA